MSATDEYLSLRELADLLRVPRKTIYGLRYRGEAPPAVRVGRELRFRLSAVEEWIAARTDNGGRAA